MLIHEPSHLMSSDPPREASSKRIRMEPFQIFSLRRRTEVAQQNPGLTNSALISLLGRMWRALPPNEKEEYMDLALNVDPADRPTRRRRSPRPAADPDDDTPILDEAQLKPSSDAPKQDDGPRFSIIPRGFSGTQAANASHHIVFPGSTQPN
jgi:hypothetical protein